MKLNITEQRLRARAAFTLAEVMMGVAVMAVMFVSLYLGFTQGFAVIQLARENLRATQVLQEKMETVRLYTWEQINTPGFIPATFTAPFYATGSGTNQGIIYNGTVSIGNPNPAMAESYAADMKQVDVQLSWTSGNVLRTRKMRTLVSRYGLHNYIY
jgi:type II secretory pathway pseudopilin PulG